MKRTELPYCRFFCLCILLSLGTIGKGYAQFIKPERYYTFDETNLLRSVTGGPDLDTEYYRCPITAKESRVRRSALFQSADCIVNTGFLTGKKPSAITIEFLFRGKTLQYLSFPTQALNLYVSGTELYFRTTSFRKGATQTDELTIPLNGTGRKSSFYLMDGDWHHLVFMADLQSCTKEIWLDGELLPGGRKKIPDGDYLVFSDMDGLKGVQEIDELAYYPQRLGEQQIRQHYAEFTLGQNYGFSPKDIKPATSRAVAKGEPTEFIRGFDGKEFAPGYPKYRMTALEQLRSFPLPRFKSGVSAFRNISWADITYLHLVYPNAVGKGVSDPAIAAGIAGELARNWNYYIDIPCLRTDAPFSSQKYGNNRTVEGALVELANRNPDLPASTIILQAQNKPEHIGQRHQGPFVSSQQLPDRYYLRNAKGEAIMYNGRKWLSPLMPMDVIQTDGRNSRFYVTQLTRFLKRPLSLINENGEVYGNIRPEELWKADPNVFRQYKASGLSNYQYNGLFQYRLDSVYKAEIMSLPGLEQTRFTFYNLSAVQSAYWPDYKLRRDLNSKFGGRYRSTPDFYPATPDNWTLGRGSLNGYGLIAEGRKTEIALGDDLFSPFVSAGWDVEEKNIRPAQWLGLLKAMVMLGADFFYTGYFNVTDDQGNWPNKSGPNDPAGYVYQLALPAYAQAMTTYASDFFSKGQLLNPADPLKRGMEFRFEGNNPNELILVRKAGAKYLIYGSIQPSSNAAGTVPFQAETSIMLEGQRIRFMIRRQGSMYIYDKSGSSPLFYAIDGWHQYEHPAFWKDQVCLEAELADSLSKGISLATVSGAKTPDDFTNPVTAALFNEARESNPTVEWKLVPRSRTKPYASCEIRLQASRLPSVIRLRVNGKAGAEYKVAVSGDWTTITVPVDNLTELRENRISLELVKGEIRVDWLMLK